MTSSVETAVETAFRVVYLLVLVEVILSWIPQARYHPAARLLRRIVDPLLRPFRRLLPPWRTGGLDVSPILLLLALWAADRVIVALIPG